MTPVLVRSLYAGIIMIALTVLEEMSINQSMLASPSPVPTDVQRSKLRDAVGWRCAGYRGKFCARHDGAVLFPFCQRQT